MSEEPDEETLTRNWDELLQEIRVTQTGVQILTGFLLTVPFSNGFPKLDSGQKAAYLVVLAGAILTTGLVIAPVAFHRVLFRHRRRALLVDVGNWCSRAGLVTLALTVSGVLFLVFDVVVDLAAGLVSLTAGAVFFALLWGVAPKVIDRLDPAPHNPPPGHRHS